MPYVPDVHQNNRSNIGSKYAAYSAPLPSNTPGSQKKLSSFTNWASAMKRPTHNRRWVRNLSVLQPRHPLPTARRWHFMPRTTRHEVSATRGKLENRHLTWLALFNFHQRLNKWTNSFPDKIDDVRNPSAAKTDELLFLIIPEQNNPHETARKESKPQESHQLKIKSKSMGHGAEESVENRQRRTGVLESFRHYRNMMRTISFFQI